jgi:acyl-homoserine lactone acylase PvdQ
MLLGNETRYLRAYLLAAIVAEAPGDAQLQAVADRLAGWDGRLVTDVVSDTHILPEQQIWSTWLSNAMLRTFGDELGSYWDEADLNALLHALDGLGSGVPPSRDYFDDVFTAPVETANEVLVQAVRDALDLLEARYGTPDMDTWVEPRPVVPFVHPLGLALGQVPLSNRATYAQIVDLGSPIVAENVLPLGQSGFISPTGVPDPHFGDQLALYRAFELKPMRLVALAHAYVPIVLRSFPSTGADWGRRSVTTHRRFG